MIKLIETEIQEHQADSEKLIWGCIQKTLNTKDLTDFRYINHFVTTEKFKLTEEHKFLAGEPSTTLKRFILNVILESK